MKDFDQRWQRLTARARTAPAGGGEAAPYGFATRVVARAFAVRPAGAGALFEKFALRGLLAAGVLGVASMAYSYIALTAEADEDFSLASDPLPELLGWAS